MIATPGLLIAFLRTVALAWRQQEMQRNADKIVETARDLYGGLDTYAGHVDKMGRGLRQAVGAYNRGVGSFQSRMLVQARRFEELIAAGKRSRSRNPPPSTRPSGRSKRWNCRRRPGPTRSIYACRR